MWIFTQVWIDLVYSVFRTFTEDKALTAAACYSLCSFFCVFTNTQFENNEKLCCFLFTG